jgi:hypothetical protein
MGKPHLPLEMPGRMRLEVAAIYYQDFEDYVRFECAGNLKDAFQWVSVIHGSHVRATNPFLINIRIPSQTPIEKSVTKILFSTLKRS